MLMLLSGQTIMHRLHPSHRSLSIVTTSPLTPVMA
jgi:hypothetical protein